MAPDTGTALAFSKLEHYLAPIRWISISLLASYLIMTISVLFPLRLLAPEWQQRVIATLVNNAPNALTGLALIYALRFLGPELTANRRLFNFTTRWAAMASLGFFLLIPLQAWTGFNLYEKAKNDQATQSLVAEQQFNQAKASAESIPDIQSAQRILRGINPTLSDQISQAPLSELRQRFIALANQQLKEAKARIQSRTAEVKRATLLESLRIGFTALVFGIAFFFARFRPIGLVPPKHNVKAGQELIETKA